MNNRILKGATALVAATLIASGAVAVSTSFAAASTRVAAVVAQAEDEKGVLIAHVEKDGPASKAGLRRGDILLSLDGKTVDDVAALREAVTALEPNAVVKVIVDRGGAEQTLTLTTGDRDGAAYLGISLADMPTGDSVTTVPSTRPTSPMTDTAKTEAMPVGRGFGQVSVTEVMTSSPAEKAGLKKGDVISAVGGQILSPRTNFAELVGAKKPGDTLTMTIKASIAVSATTRTVSVTLGTNPDKAGVAWLGIQYRPVFMMMTQDGTPSDGTLPQLPSGRSGRGQMPNQQAPGQQGAWVANVVTDSPASKAGLVERDLIVEFNGSKVADANTVVKAVQALKVGDVVTLTVLRGTENQTITVTLGDNPANKGKPYMGVELGSMSFRTMPGIKEGSLMLPDGMDESGIPNLDDLLNQLRQQMPDVVPTTPDGSPSQGNL